MPSAKRIPITSGEPNWVPLEATVTPAECESFMYMGRAGQIELYKHVLTRRYLNICPDGRRFCRLEGDEYVEISKVEALEHVRR